MKKIILGEVCEKIGSGATPRGGSEVYLPQGEITLIRSQNIYNDGFKKDGLAYITEVHAKELDNVAVEPDDILLNITGDSVARCCQVPDKFIPARVNQHVAIIRPRKDSLDARYLRYYLVSPTMQDYMLTLAGGGATRNALTKGMIESFEIPAPPLPEQRAIAGILGALDDKIELNRRMNATLEALAKALFKSWFVNFDPVRRNADPLSGASGGRLKDEDALFPDGFEESPLGEIPRGWRVGPILSFADLLSGGTPSTKVDDYWNGNIKWISAKDVSTAQGTFVLDTERKVTELGVENSSTKILTELTTIVTARGTVGSYCILGEPMAMNQTNYGLKAKEPDTDFFVFLSLANLVSQLKQNAYGTIFDTVTTRTFETSQVIVPPLALMQEFNKQVQPMMEMILKNLQQSCTLAALRDALLPRLMSGEVRVAVHE